MKLPCSKKRPWIVTADLPAGAVLAGLSGKSGQVTFVAPLWVCVTLSHTLLWEGKVRPGVSDRLQLG